MSADRILTEAKLSALGAAAAASERRKLARLNKEEQFKQALKQRAAATKVINEYLAGKKVSLGEPIVQLQTNYLKGVDVFSKLNKQQARKLKRQPVKRKTVHSAVQELGKLKEAQDYKAQTNHVVIKAYPSLPAAKGAMNHFSAWQLQVEERLAALERRAAKLEAKQDWRPKARQLRHQGLTYMQISIALDKALVTVKKFFSSDRPQDISDAVVQKKTIDVDEGFILDFISSGD